MIVTLIHIRYLNVSGILYCPKIHEIVLARYYSSFWSYPDATPATISYTPNALDQYAGIGAVTPTYNGNGELTYDGTFTYGYDAEGRLISASGRRHYGELRLSMGRRRSSCRTRRAARCSTIMARAARCSTGTPSASAPTTC